MPDFYTANDQLNQIKKRTSFTGADITISSPTASIGAVAWDGVNLYSGAFSDDTIYKHSGFSDTILGSFVTGHGNSFGVSIAGGDIFSASFTTGRIYWHDGFSSSIKDSFEFTDTTIVRGITVADGNIIACNAYDTYYKYVGFSNSIAEQIASPSNGPNGASWDGTDFYSTDANTEDKLYHHSGFSTTILASTAAPDSVPRDIEVSGRPLTAPIAGGSSFPTISQVIIF